MGRDGEEWEGGIEGVGGGINMEWGEGKDGMGRRNQGRDR